MAAIFCYFWDFMSPGENFCHFSPSNHMKEGKRKDQKSLHSHFPPQPCQLPLLTQGLTGSSQVLQSFPLQIFPTNTVISSGTTLGQWELEGAWLQKSFAAGERRVLGRHTPAGGRPENASWRQGSWKWVARGKVNMWRGVSRQRRGKRTCTTQRAWGLPHAPFSRLWREQGIKDYNHLVWLQVKLFFPPSGPLWGRTKI